MSRYQNRCTAITRSGTRCRNNKSDGNFCTVHRNLNNSGGPRTPVRDPAITSGSPSVPTGRPVMRRPIIRPVSPTPALRVQVPLVEDEIDTPEAPNFSAPNIPDHLVNLLRPDTSGFTVSSNDARRLVLFDSTEQEFDDDYGDDTENAAGDQDLIKKLLFATTTGFRPDFLNKKQLTKVLESFTENYSEQTEDCPVCFCGGQETSVGEDGETVVDKAGYSNVKLCENNHWFCLECAKKIGNKCPTCRNRSKIFPGSSFLNMALSLYVSSMSEDFQKEISDLADEHMRPKEPEKEKEPEKSEDDVEERPERPSFSRALFSNRPAPSDSRTSSRNPSPRSNEEPEEPDLEDEEPEEPDLEDEVPEEPDLEDEVPEEPDLEDEELDLEISELDNESCSDDE